MSSMLVEVATPSSFSVSSAYAISSSRPSVATSAGNVAIAPKRMGCFETMSASCSLIRLASWQASSPFAWLAESGSDKTDAEIPFASMSDKDCSTDQGGSLSIGACDPRFVMMWEWTSMILLMCSCDGKSRLHFSCLSFSRNPLADVRWAILERDVVRFAALEKTDRVLIHEG